MIIMTMRIVTFKIEEELLEKLDRYAKIRNLSRSDAIRKAIKLLLEVEEASAVKYEAKVYTRRIY